MPFHTPTQFFWIAGNLLVCGYALWKGGGPERLTALASLVASRVSAVVEHFDNFVSPQWGVFGVDLLFFAFLVVLALRTDRAWLLFAAAFQLLNLATHVAILTDPGLRARVYMTAIAIWSYLILASLAVGTWALQRARRLPA